MMKATTAVAKISFAVAIIAAMCLIIVQMVKETRGQVAALVLKPIPAGCAAFACFLVMISITHIDGSGVLPTRRHRISSRVPVMCILDTWCLMFGLAFVAFSIGDGLLSDRSPVDRDVSTSTSNSSSTSEAMSSKKMASLLIGGVSAFAVGHLLILTSLFLRRIPKEPAVNGICSTFVTVMYAVLAVIVWVTFTFSTWLSPGCRASFTIASLLATYYLAVIAVAWKTTDIATTHDIPGIRSIALGANLFLLSDLIVGSESLCAIFARGDNETIYYLLAMLTYYAAILLEAYGVTRFALDTRTVHDDNADYSG